MDPAAGYAMPNARNRLSGSALEAGGDSKDVAVGLIFLIQMEVVWASRRRRWWVVWDRSIQSLVPQSGKRVFVQTECKQEALVGGVGQEYVQSVLSTTEPAAAVATIQRQAGLPDPRTRPLLQLLDQLGRSR